MGTENTTHVQSDLPSMSPREAFSSPESHKERRLMLSIVLSAILGLSALVYLVTLLLGYTHNADTKISADTEPCTKAASLPGIPLLGELPPYMAFPLVRAEGNDLGVPVEATPSVEYEVPEAESGQKTFMDYRAITSRTSDQYALQQNAATDGNGFRRINDFYLVAMGTFYSEKCGKTFEIALDNGTVFSVMVGDIKQDAHTDELHQHRNGNVLEFIVDSDTIGSDCRLMGDMSYTVGMNLHGKIMSIKGIDTADPPDGRS